MRTPFQVLVIPFRRTADGLEFAALKRADDSCWQFVAGGGEDDETPVQTAERETKEEIAITAAGRLIPLDSMAMVPRACFAAAELWGPEIAAIPEHCFAVDVVDEPITLSSEHTEARWVCFDVAFSLLQWNSNRAALRELDERLNKGLTG